MATLIAPVVQDLAEDESQSKAAVEVLRAENARLDEEIAKQAEALSELKRRSHRRTHLRTLIRRERARQTPVRSAEKAAPARGPARTARPRSHATTRSSSSRSSSDDDSSGEPPPPGAVLRGFAALFGGLDGGEQHARFVALPADSQDAFWADIGREATARNELVSA